MPESTSPARKMHRSFIPETMLSCMIQKTQCPVFITTSRSYILLSPKHASLWYKFSICLYQSQVVILSITWASWLKVSVKQEHNRSRHCRMVLFCWSVEADVWQSLKGCFLMEHLLYMGVSKNRGTPKWMVYNGKPLLKWMIWGYHYFLQTPIYPVIRDSSFGINVIMMSYNVIHSTPKNQLSILNILKL